MTQTTTGDALEIGLRHHRAGRLREAEIVYRQILQQQPNNADAMHLLGNIGVEAGQLDAGIELIKRAISIYPVNASYYSNLGNALRRKGQHDEAVGAYRDALKLNPDFADAWSNLGNALRDLKQLGEALKAFENALRLNPQHADAYVNLANALSDAGRRDEAIAACVKAIHLRPTSAEAYYNLGNFLRDAGRLDDALGAYGQCVRHKPDYALAYHNACIVLRDLGRLDEAITAGLRATKLRPDLSMAFNQFGVVLRERGKIQEAIAAGRKAVELKADDAGAYLNLATSLRDGQQLDMARQALTEVIRLEPKLAEAHNNLSCVLRDEGEVDQAVAECRKAVEMRPQSAMLRSNLIFTLHFDERCDAKTILKECREYERRHGEALKTAILPHENDRTETRRLKIGYVSSDLCEHPVGRFLLPLLENHNTERVEVYCYAQVSSPDEVTNRIRQRSAHWQSTFGMNDEQMAAKIRSDRIDVLVDLASHTAGNRLPIFARKPAPVQVTWLGCPTTTGLSAIEYRLTDPFLDPPDEGDEFYSEKSLRLPHCFWCYQPPPYAPEVSTLPAERNGYVTFGCFNQFGKVSPGTIRRWVEVMQGRPGSRLVLRCPEGASRERLGRIFRDAGIGPERIEFINRTSPAGYLAQHHRIDVCLDTSPYNGHTTACDATWMGVPTVTLSGATAVARGCASILSNVGLTKWIAQSPAEYVRIALEMTDDFANLAKLRQTLRARMQNSPLMDAKGFASDMETAYRKMWAVWCAGL